LLYINHIAASLGGDLIAFKTQNQTRRTFTISPVPNLGL